VLVKRQSDHRNRLFPDVTFIISSVDYGAYHSALGLDKKLLQIAAWFFVFAKNDQILTQGFFYVA
jgi:hypothetical protein